MISALYYQSMEKILKRHFKKCKGLYFDVGKSRTGKRDSTRHKNQGHITLREGNGEYDDKFYNYKFFINRHFMTDGTEKNKQVGKDTIINIKLSRRIEGEYREVYSEEIENLDRLFKLLAKKGKFLKDIVDKKMVVEKLTEEVEKPKRSRTGLFKVPTKTKSYSNAKMWKKLMNLKP